jgi:hypothetical protein
MGGRLKIRARPLKFFDLPNLRGQAEVSRSNQFHGLSLRISTYKKSAGAHVMNRWRRSGNVVERSETVAQVAPAMILGQRDLRLLSCEGAHVAASATLAQCALTQKGGGGVYGQKQIPRAKCALVMTIDDTSGAPKQGPQRASGLRAMGSGARGSAVGFNVAPACLELRKGFLARQPAPA